jgi:LPXTG-motif cell wall-anchored protein
MADDAAGENGLHWMLIVGAGGAFILVFMAGFGIYRWRRRRASRYRALGLLGNTFDAGR